MLSLSCVDNTKELTRSIQVQPGALRENMQDRKSTRTEPYPWLVFVAQPSPQQLLPPGA